MITGWQCHVARALVEGARPLLAKRSGVDLSVIERFETIVGLQEPLEIDAIVHA